MATQIKQNGARVKKTPPASARNLPYPASPPPPPSLFPPFTHSSLQGTSRDVLLREDGTLSHFSMPFFMSASSDPAHFLRKAIDLAVENVTSGQGGPFAALVVEDGEILAQGTNVVTTTQDPTAHAEITAIRKACEVRDHFELKGCILYSSCEPCPMCLGAIYWARLDRVVFAASRTEAAEAGFDDNHIYNEIDLPPSDRRIPMTQRLQNEAQRPFDAWHNYEDRVEY